MASLKVLLLHSQNCLPKIGKRTIVAEPAPRPLGRKCHPKNNLCPTHSLKKKMAMASALAPQARYGCTLDIYWNSKDRVVTLSLCLILWHLIHTHLHTIINYFRKRNIYGRQAHIVLYLCSACARKTRPPEAETPHLTRGYLKRSFTEEPNESSITLTLL